MKRWGKCLHLLLVLLALVKYGAGFSAGAPPLACSTLLPQHSSNSPQTSPAPYSISFTPTTFTAGGSPVTVTLTTNGGAAVFKGFLLTSQYDGACVDSSSVVGTLTAITNTTAICSATAVTHSSVNTRNSISFQWTPPATSDGHIRFRATFVQAYPTFWVDVKASTLLVNSGIAAPDPSFNPASCSSSSTSGTITKDAACGTTKGCYSDCSGSTCNFLMTWAQAPAADSILITLSALVSSAQQRYISFGLSEDSQMGSDSVNYCINAADGVYLSRNNGKSNSQLANPKEGLGNITVSYKDGILTCSFTRIIAANANGERFALDKAYTLLWAVGPGDSSQMGKHDQTPLVSTQAASLTDFTVDITGSSEVALVKAHGSLMMIAWIFAASIGMVIARYFKSEWEDKSWFGQKVWFQIHRFCMILVLLSTVIAFIIIFVHVEGYSDIQGEGYKKAHPVIGIIVTVLTVANPIMAMFRPHPGTKNRPIFNWLHWGVGTCAYTLGVISIFFGIELDQAAAPNYTIYILVAYVVWQFLVQIVLEVIRYMDSRSSGSRDGFELTDIGGSEVSKPPPTKNSSVKKRVVLALHLLVVTALTITLIVVLNSDED